MKSCFDTDTMALIQRENINKDAYYNLEEWIFQQITCKPDLHVLDLGCGTGKQMFALYERLSSTSTLTGIDISRDAVDRVNARAQREKLYMIKASECELDNVVNYFKDAHFDLILSTYAIYYAKNMSRLLISLPQLLTQNGQVFICGYGGGSNQEIYDLINASIPQASLKIPPIEDFIGEAEIAEVAQYYASYRIVRLANRVTFTSLESILTWWKNHSSFLPEVYQDVSTALYKHFNERGSFALTKNVLGIRYDV